MTIDWLVLLATLIFCAGIVAAVILKQKLSGRIRRGRNQTSAAQCRQMPARTHVSDYPRNQDLPKNPLD